MAEKTFYVTTPIYYPSDRLHIGHAYTTVAADAIARYKELRGYDTMFLTGSDEHGQKIERKADEAGKEPQNYVDEIVATFIDLWDRLGIDYDQFIRTTDNNHEEVVQEIFKQLYEQEDIYLGKYEGWYCTPCETFWLDRQLEGDEKVCPDCNRPLEWVEEESYFFKMSKYADRLLKHIKDNPKFIQPESRRNEMISFIESGLDDLSVSRTTFDWGIEVPVDTDHVIYVWIDALSNYITAMGYKRDEAKFNKYWPANIHIVGKDILRFHTIIWPIILMALDLPLPDQVFGHGWLLSDTGKMSKSRGNVVDPIELINDFGRDSIRYYLLREVSFGTDGIYSTEALIQRINSDLANDLGNLLHRSLSMVEKYFSGKIPEPSEETEYDSSLKEVGAETVEKAAEEIEELRYTRALEEIWQFVRRANKYIDQTEPWILAREEENRERLGTVLYNLLESLRMIGILLKSFLVDTPGEIGKQLGIQAEVKNANWDDLAWGGLPAGRTVEKGDPIFPRIDLEEYYEEKEELTDVDDKQEEEKVEEEGLISFGEFQEVDLRIATIIAAEKIEDSNKLLKLQVDLGDERRQIVAGIANYYQPEDLIDKQIIMVANLEPAKIFGVESQGMLLAARDEENEELTIISPAKSIKTGSSVS